MRWQPDQKMMATVASGNNHILALRKAKASNTPRRIDSMAASQPPDEAHNHGSISVLPVGSVRSVVTINPQSPSLVPSRHVDGKHRRRVLSIGPSCANPSPSVATTCYYHRNKESSNEKGGQKRRSGCEERITLVATCIPPPRADADDDGKQKSRCGRISLATIIDSPLDNDPQCCTVVGMQYSSANSSLHSTSFSVVCIATIPVKSVPEGKSSTHEQRFVLVAIDMSGRIHVGHVKEYQPDSHSQEDKRLLKMEGCQFSSTSTKATKRGKNAKTSKKSTHDESLPPLTRMNTLTARLESPSLIVTPGTTEGSVATSTPDNSQTSPRKSPRRSPGKSTPTKKKGRKRKHSPAKADAASSNVVDTTNTQRAYLVASNLNESIIPSHMPPIVMLLSSSMDDSSSDPEHITKQHWKGLAWAIIPGLEDVHVPITCIIFTSRSKCGPKIWDGIMSAMQSNVGEESKAPTDLDPNAYDDGVVFMGFQDGTLRASLVTTNKDSAPDGVASNVTLDVSKATTILQLSADEPLVSMELIPSQSPLDSTTPSIAAPILFCVGALGTVVTLSSSFKQSKKSNMKTPTFTLEYPMKPCGGRWTSMACIGYRFFDEAHGTVNSRHTKPSISLSFVGVNDSSHTYILQMSLHDNGQSRNEVNDDLGDSIHCQQEITRIPIPSRMTSSIHAFPEHLFTSSGNTTMCVTFTVSASSGKVVVFRMDLPETTNKALPSSKMGCVSGTISFLLSSSKVERLLVPNHDDQKYEIDHCIKNESSKIQSLIQKLDMATAKQNKDKSNQMYDSINRTTDHATREIREVTQIAAFISRPLSKSVQTPMQCKIKKLSPGILECTVTTEKLPLTRQPTSSWVPSFHILQSCHHALSSALRPKSIHSLSPICYRRTATKNDGGPAIVVYGGTATSYNGGVKGNVGDMMGISVAMNDFIPLSAYASFSIVYMDHVNDIKDKSTIMLSGCWNPRPMQDNTVWSQMPHISGSARRRCSHRSSISRYGKGLGVSLPFDIGTNQNDSTGCTIDLLTCTFESDLHPDVVSLGAESNPRHIAENLILRWSQSSQSNAECAIPMLKEHHLIHRHSASSMLRSAEDDKVYCCSSLVHCANLKERKEYCVNMGFGALAIAGIPLKADRTFEKEEGCLSFAVGSSIITPSESMSILPLVRQAIVRQSFDHLYYSQTTQRSGDYLMLLQEYQRLISEKKTAKITNYVSRSSADLIASLDKAHKDLCPNELLTASISLYETMRTISFAFSYSPQNA